MTTFKTFLLESERSRGLSIHEAVALVKEHCPKFLKSEIPLWRGTSSSRQAMEVDSFKGSPRKSRSFEDTNYYNQWMEYHPAWKDIPKRSRSIIVSTNYRYTKLFGETFKVFPFDNATVAILPTEDVWYIHQSNSDLSDLENLLGFIGKYFPSIVNVPIPSDSDKFSTLTNFLKDVTVDKIKSIPSAKPESDLTDNLVDAIKRLCESVVKDMEAAGVNNMFDFFEAAVTPKDFEVSLAGDLSSMPPERREVMISGRAILVNENDLSAFDHLMKQE